MRFDPSWTRRIARLLQGAPLLVCALNLSAVSGCGDPQGDVASQGTGGTAAGGAGAAGGSGGTGNGGGTGGATGGTAGSSGGAGSAGTGGVAGTGGAAGSAGAAGAAGGAGAAGAAGGAGAAGAAGGAGAAGAAGSGGSAWPAACAKCHGEPDNPAPPRDLDGNIDPVHPGVGAHRAHLGASSWRHEFQCAECHVVPTHPGWDPETPTHLNGFDDLVWGPIAKQGTYHTGTGTCSSSYCHGGAFGPDSPGQSSNRNPVWTTVDGTQASCGTSCHTLPPGGGHPPSTACETCHGKVIASYSPGSPPSVIWADANLHIDGMLEVAGLSCTACHGDPITHDPAPPRGTQGETSPSKPAVGAHAQHLAPSGWHRRGLCTDCHAYPGSLNHANGAVDFAWGGPSNTGNPGPAYATASSTCTNTYCHGSTLDGPKPGGSVRRTPVWNQVDGTFDGCGTTCHTNPPGGSHPASTACATCHDTVVAAYVATNPPQVTWKNAELHVDGMVQVGSLSCTSCHGDPVAGTPAPPMGTSGETATTQAAVGAHAQHLAPSTWHRQGQCTDCHAYPGSIQHADGAVDFAWGGPSNVGNPGPSYVAGTTTCNNTYCHGSTLDGPKPGGTVQRTPDWTEVNGTQAACGTTCHTNPPGGGHVAISDCKLCHGQVIDQFDPTSGSATWVLAANHVNGVVESNAYHDLPQWTAPKEQSQHHGTSFFLSNRQRDEHGTGCTVCHGANLDGGKVGVSCNNTSCHGGQDWKSCTFCHGTPPAQSNPPRGVYGETTSNTLGVGRHAAHLTNGASHLAFSCNTCHEVPAAGDVSHAIDYVPSTSLDVPGHHGDVEFSGAASGMQFDVTATQGSPVAARGTCLLACHSDGRGNPPNVTPYWAGGSWKKGDCGSCHDAAPTTADHGIHHAQGGCSVCHPAVPGASHVNGVRDVKTSILGPKGGGMVAFPPGSGGPGAPCGNRWTCNGMCHGNAGSRFHSQYCW